jgi:type IV pilus assembly protein PilY1
MRQGGAALLAALLGLACGGPSAALTTGTTLGDSPVLATANVPGNLALVLSVEYPTAISVANNVSYADASTFLGYFDPVKCYNYVFNSTTPNQSYFQPAAFGTGTYKHQCSGMWSGNFMNWATMQTIDPFRWALTGGYRSLDTATGSAPYTILEKAWGSLQGAFSVSGGYWNSTSFPFRGTEQADPNSLPSSLVAKVTPFTTWKNFNSAIWANGNQMVFSGTGTAPATQNTGYYTAYGATVSGSNVTVTSSATSSGGVYNLQNDLTGANVNPQSATFRIWVRVSVCDQTLGVAYLESNCTKYVNGGSTVYKPEGLLQQYSNQMRYADMSYLNADGQYQQGGVLREPMGFIGPTYPQPLSSTLITNTRPEWSATTGVQIINPDTTSANASGVQWSGVLNYLNKFGEYTATVSNASNTNTNTNTYMKNDNVSELYYAAIRYFEYLGNVSTWSTLQSGIPSYPTTVQLDGFPAVSTWTDPIAYSCQKNFILGIGDDHTHFDFNVANNGGATDQYITRNSPTFSDSFNQSTTWTSDVESLEGLSGPPWYNYYNSAGTFATYFMSGLAYGAHINDIRSDLTGTQTISTYWMDVDEYGYPENENMYYLATKYGGFTVPSGYTINTPLTQSSWDTSNNTMTTHVSGAYSTSGTLTSVPLPDNYFNAGQASTMVSGLQSAFANIATAVQSYATSFSLSSPLVATAGELSFSSQYNSTTWTSVITANTLTFNSGTPTQQQLWVSSATLQSQLAGTGWQAPYSGGSTGRNIATWNGSGGAPFEVANLTTAQLAALVPSSYSPTTTSTQFVKYLRGDTTNQVGSTAAGSTKSLRARTFLLGDIVDANLTSVGTPGMGYSEANNPGYTAFTKQWTTTTPRPTMVYAGANDGMLHGVVGSSGLEQFAYIPSALFQGPTGTPQINGLAALGNPSFAHHFYVDASPGAFDVDLTRTNGTTTATAGTANWHTLLIGGLGKGGASYYAIDVTNPAAMTSESAVAGDVLWEFTDSTMGYSFATPIVVKTVQYGWVVILTSGYDNADGYGYLYIVNPANGVLLQKIKTPNASTGLTQASAFVQDYTDYTADSVYVGDLNGQLWRFDLTEASGNYPAPTQIATLTDASGNVEPVTSAPLIAIHPTTRQRYVLLGTGKLLSSADVSSTQVETFYAIIDGTAAGFATGTAVTTRANLQPVTDITAGITVATGFNGWYYDLPAGFRVVTEAATYNGIVAFSTLGMSTDPCSPQGSSDVYAVNYYTGVSVLNSTSTSTTTPPPYVSFSVAVNNLEFVSNNGTVELIAGTTGSTSGSSSGSSTSGSSATATSGPGPYQIPGTYTSISSTRLLNWRQIPSAE